MIFYDYTHTKEMFYLKKILALWMAFLIMIQSTGYVSAKEIPDLKIRSGILIEEKSGKVIYAKNTKEKLAIASITKLMTYLLAEEEIKKGKIAKKDKVKISKKATVQGGATLYLRQGEEIDLEELMRGMMIISANDAAFAIGEYVGKGEANFVKRMNEKAKEIGMKDTLFFNPNGMPLEDGRQNLSTAKDLGILAKYLIDHHGKELLKLTDTEYYKNEDRNFRKESTNHTLLRLIPEVDGLKTGYTEDAGYCLIATMEKKSLNKEEDNLRWISVVLGTASKKDRTYESKKLLDYGNENYIKKIIVHKGTALENEKGLNIFKLPFKMILPENITLLKSKEEARKMDIKTLIKEKKVTVKEKIKFPMEKGDKVGSVTFVLKDNTVIKSDLVSDKKVEKMPMILRIKYFFKSVSDAFSKGIGKVVKGFL